MDDEERQWRELVAFLNGKRLWGDRLRSIVTWLSVVFVTLYMVGCISP